MWQIVRLSWLGFIHDRLLQGVSVVAIALLAVPALSPTSMRQVSELAIILSLSLVSFISLLITVFSGGITLFNDIDKRYLFLSLSWPISRVKYLLGRYFGFCSFLFSVFLFLTLLSWIVICLVVKGYPPSREVSFFSYIVAMSGIYMKCILLVSFSFLFSVFSTSMFLPIFGTLVVYFVGEANQSVHDYILSGAYGVPGWFKPLCNFLYWILPNLDAFDFSVYAVYGINLDFEAFFYSVFYFLGFCSCLMYIATVGFMKREIK